MEQVISIGENKDVRVHDINSHLCLQTFFRKMIPDTSHRAISASFFNKYRQALVFATARLMLLEHRDDDLRNLQIMSHTQPVTAALYNPLFKQVVSVAADSTVAVWTMITGHKVMQFNAAKQRESAIDVIEVTAMSFDSSFRRLITATRLGVVSIWNFNNGACLHEFPNNDHSQITSVIYERGLILCGGWNKRVTIYCDNNADPRHVRWLSPRLSDDILDMVLYPPQILATSSYDGRIYIWSLAMQSLMYALDTERRQRATGDMYDFKRRGSEVERAALATRKEKASRKVAAVSRLVDVVTQPGYTSDELKLPQIVVGVGLACPNTAIELTTHPSTSTVGKCVCLCGS
ncbi:hypothetical protein NP493_404g02061 [Ridgeia piscesae]|uniref:WD repeat-containing protein on Y chromosome n=1 Tax=Ridgeia piscesae TaxID=27915 RepID=A0AAD9NSL7_RIDPI|nr:hypothetical protein NP493_404g02061 [Ridgeia piscesae]